MDDCMKDCQTLINEKPTHHGWLRQKNKFHKCGEAIGKNINSIQNVTSKLVSKVPWDRHYVVLCDCFLIIFKDETSKRAERVIRLAEFYKATKTESDNRDVPWPFMLVKKETEKEMLFAASSQEEQSKWLKCLQELFQTMPKYSPKEPTTNDNEVMNKSGGGRSGGGGGGGSGGGSGGRGGGGGGGDDDDDEDDADYEIPSVEKGTSSYSSNKYQQRGRVPLPPIPLDSRKSKGNRADDDYHDDDDSNGLYDCVDDVPDIIPASKPTPARNFSVISAKKKPPPTPIKPAEVASPSVERYTKSPPLIPEKPKPKEKPGTLKKPTQNSKPEPKVILPVQPAKKLPALVTESEYELDKPFINYAALTEKAMWHKDPNKATEIMSCLSNETGAYLIRKSADGDGYTLSVICEDGPKKFKITIKDDKLIMSQMTFDEMPKLIEHFTLNNLPNKHHKLTKPFSELWSEK